MGKLSKSSDAPASADYSGAAQATAAGNLQNLQYQTQANRPDINTAWGSSTWTQGTGADGKPNNQWTNNVTLSPQQQAALDSQMNVQQGQSSLGQMLQGQVADTMSTPYQAPNRGDYMGGVGNVNQSFSGFTPTGVGAVNQSTYDPRYATLGSQPLNQTFNGGPGVNTNFAGGPSQNLNFSSSGQGVNTNFAGGPSQNLNFSSSGQGVNTNFSGGPSQNLDAQGAVAGAGSVDLNTPQFSDANAAAGAKAAYEGSTALLKDQWEQDTTALDNKLRLQGLQPGTEAYNTAVQNQGRVQAQQQNQLAQQAVGQGNDMANQNYASALAGYGARNNAQGQAYGQGANTFQLGNNAASTQFGQNAQGFGLNNAALGQQFGQDMDAYGAQNAAANTQFGQNLSGFNAGNAALGQQFGQDMNAYGAQNTAANTQFGQNATGFGLNNAAQQQQFGQNAQGFSLTNDARTQNLNNGLAQYQAMLAGQQAGNAGQNQAFNQSLAGYGANQSAQQQGNAAQQQAYAQALQNYGLDSQSSLQQYQMPLNNMNAVMTGQQVQNPSFPGFASAGYAAGPDYLGATSAQGSWDQGLYNSKQASNGSMLNMFGNLGGAAIMQWSDVRLKKDIFRVGNTKGGEAWYIWNWKDTGKPGCGVIAQEVAKTKPEAVYVDPRTGYFMVDYAALA